ncbi:DEAD/DEAH box helicase [Polaribacter sp. 20A6]|uniref:DEAD/DEAH box helicase n=1 Tax=Polaribacter sp. 20A6 TaxID=2687289 RepID=UPI0013FD516A|nr:DEAD/DEAH box helicase [Polaribacter sp. 20A6]
MKPEKKSTDLLGVTRSKAKMFEYNVPTEHHISISRDPSKLLSLTIGIIGDYSQISSFEESENFIKQHKEEILFSAQFFDAYADSRLVPELIDYLLLVGSAAYYLADFPGSAKVLVNRTNNPITDLSGNGLENLLVWILQNETSKPLNILENNLSTYIEAISNGLIKFYKQGNNNDEILKDLEILKSEIYFNGSDRELLLSDIIISVLKKQLFNSTWNSLNRYTLINIDEWKSIISKPNFIKEFWPSQQLLGEHGVFKGKSAVIQMPTSSGKTKSTEIIIRSSFMSDKSNMAVIVAPFRALCSEIKNDLQLAFVGENVSIDEPSDALQNDFTSFDDIDLKTNKLVVIVTPEKLMYILRSIPELASKIGLLIYDEGHQFDNGIRGVTYELLLSSLRKMVSSETQIILISAVISNASSIGNWLIPNDKEIIEGQNLTPTYRTTAFASWKTLLGRLQFVSTSNPDNDDYFVPRVLEQKQLELKGRERKLRRFPEKKDGKSIALYLSIKLIEKGALAIFCGSKLTVKTIYENAVDIASRNYDISAPLRVSDSNEVGKISYLLSIHFGEESKIVKAARLGIFTHSGHTPQGLRLAIEYAMQVGKIKFIICTSTLAQGVNLPIKYLLITGFYQAGQKIRTRDFHNLIGRAGRSGIHTEGSIIFTDTELYDKKSDFRQNWKWNMAKAMLDPSNSEPCGSTLLSIFDPLLSDDKDYSINISPLKFVEAYLDSSISIIGLAQEFSQSHAHQNFTKNGLSFQINYKIQIISSIESFLMANWENYKLNDNEESIDNIAKETLAYSISTKEQKEQLLQLFRLLGGNVKDKVKSPIKRLSYSRTLFGVQDIIDIEKWVEENSQDLFQAETFDKLLAVIWSIIYQKNNSKLKNITPIKSSFILLEKWIDGITYFNIHQSLTELSTKITAGTQSRNLNQENIIDICEGSFSYETTLVLASIVEIINLNKNHDDAEIKSLSKTINILQKRIKYGLPSELAISFFELGFADRVIAIDLSKKFPQYSVKRNLLMDQISANQIAFIDALSIYPSYYTNILKTMTE